MNLEYEKSLISILQQTDLYKLVLHEQKDLGEAVLDNAIVAFTSQSMPFEQSPFYEVLVKANHQQNLNGDNAKVGDASEENQGNQGAQHQENEDNQPESKEDGKEKAEPKSTETPPESAIESPNGVQQTPDNVEHINVLTEAQLLLIGGHTANLIYRDNGLDYLQQSVPRDLNIENEFSPFIPRFFELVKPPAISQASEGPCCIDPIEIVAFNTGCSGINVPVLESLLNSSFKFTFEGFCDDETSLILFQQVGGGATISEGGEVFPITDSKSIGESFTIQVIPDEYGHCSPLTCDNPITEIAINFFGGDISLPYSIGCIDFFLGSNVTFIAKDGDEWQLIGTKTGFALVCAQEVETAPLVFDLNHNGFDLTSAKTSNVMLDFNNGLSGNVGWVGPGDGLLTYNYSGSGPINNNNFILTQNVSGAKTDLQALESLAGKTSGIIDHSNAIWDKLGMWVDGNQNGKMDTGEYHTLSQLGITGINLSQVGGASQVNGNTINSVISFNYADGTTGKAADVTLKLEDVVQSNQSVVELNSTNTASSSASVGVPVAPTTVAAPAAPTHTDPTVTSAIEAITTTQHT